MLLYVLQSTRGVKLQSKYQENRPVRLGMRFGKPCLRCLLCAFGRVVRVGKGLVLVSTRARSALS